MYNTSAQTVAPGSDVTFDSNGVLNGIAHTAGDSIITLTSGGDYLVTFDIGATGPGQFVLTLGGASVTGARYGRDLGLNVGQAIISAATGATATIRNEFSSVLGVPVSVGIPTGLGGTGLTANASINIHRLD
ncbi:hypothetical protein JCM15765_14100 [Paradesulfitobacterium aromaticivorans]